MDGQIDPDDLDAPVVLTIFVLSFSIPLTGCYWLTRPSGASRGWLKQALLLQAVVWLGSGFILWAGDAGETFAFERTLRNARLVAAAVEEFRLRKGRYPRTLGEVEEDSGRALPRPVYAGDFGYGQEDGTFQLIFSRKARGYWQGWILDGRSGVLITLC
jgi:hypothetical protein